MAPNRPEVAAAAGCESVKTCEICVPLILLAIVNDSR